MTRSLATSTSLLAFIFLLSLSLRGPVVAMAPMLTPIQSDLALSSSALGLLISLPLLCFALFAPLASWLGQRAGIEKALMLAAVLILLGIVLRSLGLLTSLYTGVVLIGAGIAIGNVLLPILLKRDFPSHILTLTAIYVLMMNLGGALMAGSAVPIALLSEHWLGTSWPSWSSALLSQAGFIVLPILLWFKLPRRPFDSSFLQVAPPRPVWRSPLAWLLTLFIALNSTINYVMNAWIPTILIAKGHSAVDAGLYQSYIQFAGIFPALVLPFLQRFYRSERQLTGLAIIATLAGMAGFTFAPALAALWSLCFGFGSTLGFIIGLSLISLRTHSVKEATALSGMAQFVGYLIAAEGPVLFGALFDWCQDWQIPLYLLIALGIVWAILGWYASPASDVEGCHKRQRAQ